jgi:tRNA-dihydrouridine synthase A
MINRAFSVAPMLDWTDRHERYFLRLISKHALLYTEMLTTGAILHGHRERFLQFNPAEHPLALQLGGSEPDELAACAKIGADQGYDEINLNVGCPSDRVQSGRFGACLMADPELVSDCVTAMRAAVEIPVTVKHRIGIDDRDSWDELCEFVEVVARGGCEVFIVHARKAWLSGLSPKENRDIPPLQYDVVYRLKQKYPQWQFIINGGINDMQTAVAQMQHVDGVMLGRTAYHDPYLLSQVDALFYNDKHAVPGRCEIVEQLLPYIESEIAAGTRLHAITRHITGLFNGLPGARMWRRTLSEQATKYPADIDVVRRAMAQLNCSETPECRSD